MYHMTLASSQRIRVAKLLCKLHGPSHGRMHVLQISSDMHQSDILQKARCATTPCSSWSVPHPHTLQVVQGRTDYNTI